MESKGQKREQWSRKREYILASAGNVVGLGNVWRFPYLCYKNGGGVFLVPYCFFAVLCGVPLFTLETVIGQYSQQGAITCWSRLCPLSQGTGYSIMMIHMYSRVYIIVLAWALLYLIYCFRQVLPWATCTNPWNTDRCVELTSLNLTTASGNWSKSSVSEFWERGVLSMSQGIQQVGPVQWEVLLCLLACWVACYFCIWKGVRTTGKVVYFTATFPYVMLAVLLVRGLTLPGAWEGVVFYLYPEPSRLADLQVWLDACSQVMFSYGVASGTLITLSSYNKVKNNCYKDSLWLCALNSCTSFVAGFAVFSTLGFMANQQGVSIDMVVDSGPGLAFIAFPQALALMPVPQLWAVCFFIMLIMLGLDTVISLTTSGGVYQFQLIDSYGATGACLLFICLIQCVAAGWGFGAVRLCDAVKDMTGQRPGSLFKVCWKYITPLLCLVCFICSFLDSGGSSGGTMYPDWAYHLGWAMGLSSVLPIPLWAIIKICLMKGPIRERLQVLWYPADPDRPKSEQLQTEHVVSEMTKTLKDQGSDVLSSETFAL